LWIEADRSVIAIARVANTDPDGAFGQMVRELPPGHSVASPMVGHIFPLQENDDQRTNIGLTNVAEGVSQVRLRFLDGEGLELGTQDPDRAPSMTGQTRRCGYDDHALDPIRGRRELL